MIRMNFKKFFLVAAMGITTCFCGMNTVLADNTDAKYDKKIKLMKKIESEEADYLFLNNSSESTGDSERVENDYLKLSWRSNGRFQLITKEGNPNNTKDNDKILMFGGSTSYSTVSIEGNIHEFFNGGKVVTRPTAENNSLIAEYQYDDINVKQILKFKMNPSTGREDILSIAYRYENTGMEEKKVGLRIMLDTMLGDNDGAPFRIPNVGDVTNEMEFTRDNMPQYWQAFDNFDEPSVVSQGTLYNNESMMPDRFVLAYWGKINDYIWDYDINSEKSISGDSAVAMWWNEEPLYPGESRTYETFYGISDLESTGDSNFTSNITGPTELEAKQEGYEPNPFTITLYLKNTSGEVKEGVKAKIELPEGLKVFNSIQEVELGSMNPQDEKQISWSLFAADQIEDKVLNYSVAISAKDTQEQTVHRSVKVPKALKEIEIVVPEVSAYELKRDIGIEYEQRIQENKSCERPEILKLSSNKVEEGIYILGIDQFEVDKENEASEFFFWKTKDGYFEAIDEKYKTVKFYANPGTEGEMLQVSAFLGDGLGKVASKEIFVEGTAGETDGINIEILQEPDELKGWDTYYVQCTVKPSNPSTQLEGTNISVYYTLDGEAWNEIIKDAVDREIFSWIVPNKKSEEAKIKIVAQNGNSIKTIYSREFSIKPVCYVQGKVVDLNGNGVPDMKIKIGEKTAISDSTGYYIIKGLNPGEHIVKEEGNDRIFLKSEYRISLDYYNPYYYRVFRVRE